MDSEDFAYFAKEIPSAYMLIGGGSPEENPPYGKPMHSRDIVFNEEALKIGAAFYAFCALNYTDGCDI